MAALVGTFNEAITKNIWYRFSGPDTEAGMVEVSYTSLRAVYPVLDSTAQYSTVQYSTVQYRVYR